MNDMFALLSISRATTCERVGFKMAQKYRIIKKELLGWTALETLTFRTVLSALSPDDEKYSCTVIGPHLDCSQALETMATRTTLSLVVELLVDPLVQGVEDRILPGRI